MDMTRAEVFHHPDHVDLNYDIDLSGFSEEGWYYAFCEAGRLSDSADLVGPFASEAGAKQEAAEDWLDSHFDRCHSAGTVPALTEAILKHAEMCPEALEAETKPLLRIVSR